MSGRRADDRNPRALGTNPRAKGSNPRVLGTNPHAGKSEAAGQWRAAFRRIDRMTPERRHEILSDLARIQPIAPELERALRRRLEAPSP